MLQSTKKFHISQDFVSASQIKNRKYGIKYLSNLTTLH